MAKPLIVTAGLGALGYRRRVSLETGLGLAQISEFSLILAALGLRLGHIDEGTTALLTTVALVTIAVSVYLSQRSQELSDRLAPALGIFERRAPRPDREDAASPAPDVIVLGLGGFGSGIVAGLRERGVGVLGVDFDPVALARFEQRGISVVYGDGEDPELPHALPLPHGGWVVSTLRRADANLALLHALAEHGFDGKVAVGAHRAADVDRLLAAGATVVPHRTRRLRGRWSSSWPRRRSAQ